MSQNDSPRDNQNDKPISNPTPVDASSRPAWAEPAGSGSSSTTQRVSEQAVPVSLGKSDQPAQVVVEQEQLTAPVRPAERPVGRAADESAAHAQAASAPTDKAARQQQPQLSPQERLKRQNWASLGSRMIGGLVTLGLLLAALSSGLDWPNVLFLWVLLTIVADEFGGWFGYIAAFMGALTLLGLGHQPAENWKIILPLVGGGLLALLLVKHSGGWGVLPFAAAVFALPILAASQFGEMLDPNLLLVADPDLIRSAVLGMLIGVGLSLVRQFILWIVDLGAHRTERRILHADQLPKKGTAKS